MSSAKKLEIKAALSANDVLCKKFLEYKAQVAKLNKKIADIQVMLERDKSYATRNYMVICKTKKAVPRAMGLKLGVSIYGPGFAKNMTKSDTVTFKIEPKE